MDYKEFERVIELHTRDVQKISHHVREEAFSNPPTTTEDALVDVKLTACRGDSVGRPLPIPGSILKSDSSLPEKYLPLAVEEMLQRASAESVALTVLEDMFGDRRRGIRDVRLQAYAEQIDIHETGAFDLLGCRWPLSHIIDSFDMACTQWKQLTHVNGDGCTSERLARAMRGIVATTYACACAGVKELENGRLAVALGNTSIAAAGAVAVVSACPRGVPFTPGHAEMHLPCGGVLTFHPVYSEEMKRVDEVVVKVGGDGKLSHIGRFAVNVLGAVLMGAGVHVTANIVDDEEAALDAELAGILWMQSAVQCQALQVFKGNEGNTEREVFPVHDVVRFLTIFRLFRWAVESNGDIEKVDNDRVVIAREEAVDLLSGEGWDTADFLGEERDRRDQGESSEDDKDDSADEKTTAAPKRKMHARKVTGSSAPKRGKFRSTERDTDDLPLGVGHPWYDPSLQKGTPVLGHAGDKHARPGSDVVRTRPDQAGPLLIPAGLPPVAQTKPDTVSEDDIAYCGDYDGRTGEKGAEESKRKSLATSASRSQELKGGMFGSVAKDGTFGSAAEGSTFGSSAKGDTFGSAAEGGTFGLPAEGGTFGSAPTGDKKGGTFGSSAKGGTFGSASTSDDNQSLFGFGAGCKREEWKLQFGQKYTFGSAAEGGTFGSEGRVRGGGTFGSASTSDDNQSLFGFGAGCKREEWKLQSGQKYTHRLASGRASQLGPDVQHYGTGTSGLPVLPNDAVTANGVRILARRGTPLRPDPRRSIVIRKRQLLWGRVVFTDGCFVSKPLIDGAGILRAVIPVQSLGIGFVSFQQFEAGSPGARGSEVANMLLSGLFGQDAALWALKKILYSGHGLKPGFAPSYLAGLKGREQADGFGVVSVLGKEAVQGLEVVVERGKAFIDAEGDFGVLEVVKRGRGLMCVPYDGTVDGEGVGVIQNVACMF